MKSKLTGLGLGAALLLTLSAMTAGTASRPLCTTRVTR